MKLNRRNTLIGLGTIVAGGGAALGTGAFSSVEADRDVSLDVAGDDGALLQLTVSGGIEGSDGEDVISLSQDQLNLDALTTYSGALTVAKASGTGPVDVEINDGEVGDPGDDDLIETSASNLSASGAPQIYFVFSNGGVNTDGTNNVLELTSSNSSRTADVVINTLGEESTSGVFDSTTETILFDAGGDGDAT